MKIEKTFSVNAPVETVWQFITSPEKVAPCIPGCEGAEQTSESTYKATIKVKVGPVKAKFVVDIETIEERPPEYASYMTKGEEGSKTSRLKATSTLFLTQQDDGNTQVTYTSEISLLGRLGRFGSGMMQKVADSIGNEFVGKLKEQVENN